MKSLLIILLLFPSLLLASTPLSITNGTIATNVGSQFNEGISTIRYADSEAFATISPTPTATPIPTQKAKASPSISPSVSNKPLQTTPTPSIMAASLKEENNPLNSPYLTYGLLFVASFILIGSVAFLKIRKKERSFEEDIKRLKKISEGGLSE